MPIYPSISLKTLSDEEFAVIDKAVMDCVYAAHNKFGRLFDERVYENDVAARLRSLGFIVHTQVPLLVEHGDFQKTYYLDLVVNEMLYELKVVAGLTGEHQAQALNYAILQNIRLVKLINFGEPRVRGRLLQNALQGTDRWAHAILNDEMVLLTPNCERLVHHFQELLNDWGTNLSANLYIEALVHHFGGESHCVQRREIKCDQQVLGTHRVQCHSEDHAFIVTSLNQDQAAYHKHLKVLLSHTDLRAIQWLNLNRNHVEMSTLQ
jgi:GxxExxY protein